LTTKDFKYELPKQEQVHDYDDEEDDYDDDNFVVKMARANGMESFGKVARPHLVPYVYNIRFLDTK